MSWPPITPTQQVPHAAEVHSTGTTPSQQRSSFSFQLRDWSLAEADAISSSLMIGNLPLQGLVIYDRVLLIYCFQKSEDTLAIVFAAFIDDLVRRFRENNRKASTSPEAALKAFETGLN